MSWKNIELWLEENSTSSLGLLNAPASMRDLQSLAELTKYKIPVEFFELFEGHDGTVGNRRLFNNLPFFCIKDVVSFYYGVRECLSTELESGGEFNDINANMVSLNDSDEYVPMASIDGLEGLCVVLSSDGATHGRVIYFDIQTNIYINIADNIKLFMEGFANDLNNNKYHIYGNELVTEDRSLDLPNIGRET